MDDVKQSLHVRELTAGSITQSGGTTHSTTNATDGRPGGTATVGYVRTGTDTALVTLAQNATADTWVIPINLKDGTIITQLGIHGQCDSGGNTITVDYELRKLTPATSGTVDASVQAGTQISKTADYKIDDHTALASEETVASGVAYYILVTCTTGATCDIELTTVDVTIKGTV